MAIFWEDEFGRRRMGVLALWVSRHPLTEEQETTLLRAAGGCAIPVEGVSVRQIGELVLPEDPCASVEALCRVARENRADVLAAVLPASVAASWARSEALGGLPAGAPMLLLPVTRARKGADRDAGYEFAGWYCV